MLPDATVTFSIERFNSYFNSEETIVVKTGTVTLDKDGKYSDGGEFKDTLGANVSTIELNLDESKLEAYTVDSGVLSATVKAENTAAIFGRDFGCDVSFMITTNSNRVIAVVLNYISSIGPVEAVVSYN